MAKSSQDAIRNEKATEAHALAQPDPDQSFVKYDDLQRLFLGQVRNCFNEEMLTKKILFELTFEFHRAEFVEIETHQDRQDVNQGRFCILQKDEEATPPMTVVFALGVGKGNH
jgi:hypothetical protein